MTFDLTPVLARLTKRNEVEVCVLDRAPDGSVGIPVRAFYETLGIIRKQKIPHDFEGHTVYRDGWAWLSEGYSGSGATKEQALAGMLADAGYVQVPVEATIPPLFDMEEA